MSDSPYRVARALIYDFGLDGALRYANKIACSVSASDEFRIQYAEAARIIKTKIAEVEASSKAGSFDLGMIP